MKYLAQLHKLKLFKLEDVTLIIGNVNSAKDLLLNYHKRGLITHIRRDLYSANELNGNGIIANKLEIGSNITPSSYLSYRSALEYHGLAHQLFYNIYVSSESRFREFEFEGIAYTYCKSVLSKGVYTPTLNSLIQVTDLERTVIDCIDKIPRAGGLEELIHSISDINFLEEKKLLLYLAEYNISFLYKKVGFILEYFKDNFKISNTFIDICNKMGCAQAKYLTHPTESNTFFKKWNLYAPFNIVSFLEQGDNELV